MLKSNEYIGKSLCIDSFLHVNYRLVRLLLILFSFIGLLISCGDYDYPRQTPDDELSITGVTISKAVGYGNNIEITPSLPIEDYDYYWDFACTKNISDWTKVVSLPGHTIVSKSLTLIMSVDPVLDRVKDKSVYFDTSVIFYGRKEKLGLSGLISKYSVTTPSIEITYY